MKALGRVMRAVLCAAVLSGAVQISTASQEADDGLAWLLDVDEPEQEQASTPLNPDEQEIEPVPTIPVESTADEPAPTVSPRRRPQIEEIVVTAQKRAESIQDTPISMTAFGAEQLQERGIGGLDDLQGNVPGLNVLPFPTQSSTLRMFIRGIGLNDAQITQDPAIGIYLDGVYIARSSGLAVDIADLERIEVLRGPQGTLYGRNTTAGAVNLITRRPDPDAFSMQLTGSLGQRELGSARGTINMPLFPDAALKLGMLARRQNGFVENTGPGGDFGDSRALGLRADLRWRAADWLTFDYGFDSTDASVYSPMSQAVLPPDSDKGGAELFKEFARLNTVYSTERLSRLATGAPLEDSTTAIRGHALTLTFAFDQHEIKYIGAYRSLEDRYYTDLGGGAGSTAFRLDSHSYAGPAATAAFGGPTPLVIPVVDQSQWSHELQLGGDLLDGHLQYIVGGFLFAEEAEDLTPFSHQASSALLPAQAQVLYALFPGLINSIASLAAPRIVNFNERDYFGKNRANAVFGQVTWTPDWLEQRLHLTLGYRHSSDVREAVKSYLQDTYLEVNLNGVGIARLLESAARFDGVRGKRSYSNDSFTLIAAYDLAEGGNVYAKYSSGYRSGGFNLRDPQINGDSGPASDGVDYGFGFEEGFAPETLSAAEVGVKSDWLDGRLRVNAAVFNTDFEDMQTNFLIAGTLGDTKARNAGTARIRGFELEVSAAVTAALRLSAEYAYLDARVLEVIDIEGNNVADQYPFPTAPRHSGIASADFTFAEGGWGELRGSVNYSYTGWRAGGGLPGRTDLSYMSGYAVLNARFGIGQVPIGRGSFDLAVFGQNLLDEHYVTTTVPTLPHADRAVFWGEPRRLGLELRYVW